ncbi:hypothetical protein AA0118_g5080 [Alternaria tenuissima]|nr:hypothetical protein AA0118_g5080 [Alternaria tenuissima]RYN99256.1 hypothetical protein AA0120_g1947 [Alternaria tenuissima]
MYNRFTPEEWEQENYYAYSRDISPPRNRHEEPRPGYHTNDYRTVSPIRRGASGLQRGPRVNSIRQPPPCGVGWWDGDEGWRNYWGRAYWGGTMRRARPRYK